MSQGAADSPFNKDVVSLGKKMDLAYDNKDEGKLRSLIDDAKKMIPELDAASQFYLYYILGTTQANLADFHIPHYHEKNLEKRIYYLRKCEESLKQIPEDVYSTFEPHIVGLERQLYVNYAICLDDCGRCIAALPNYFKALKIDKQFGMALGNIGLTYSWYARLVYDKGHRYYLHQYAYRYLKEAISYPDSLHPEAFKVFSDAISGYVPGSFTNFLEQPLKLKKGTSEEIEIQSYRLGGFKVLSKAIFESTPAFIKKILQHLPLKKGISEDKEEQNYRQWVLESHLFLHPLNDLPDHNFCYATDFLHLPNIIFGINENPVCLGIFNQIKQEYIFARYLYYESLHILEKPHFADKDTYLVDTLDYSLYSIRLEKMKTAFRILYSLLDKVAFFINCYFNIGLDESEINFNTFWKKVKSTLQNEKYVDLTQNTPLNAICWIRKDFYEKLCESPNPDAKYLKDLRHALEHKYVKICLAKELMQDTRYIDDLAKYYSEQELRDHTLSMLNIVREVIIYLVMAVEIEEKNKASKIKTPIGNIPMTSYEDEWKI